MSLSAWVSSGNNFYMQDSRTASTYYFDVYDQNFSSNGGWHGITGWQSLCYNTYNSSSLSNLSTIRFRCRVDGADDWAYSDTLANPAFIPPRLATPSLSVVATNSDRLTATVSFGDSYTGYIDLYIKDSANNLVGSDQYVYSSGSSTTFFNLNAGSYYTIYAVARASGYPDSYATSQGAYTKYKLSATIAANKNIKLTDPRSASTYYFDIQRTDTTYGWEGIYGATTTSWQDSSLAIVVPDNFPNIQNMYFRSRINNTDDWIYSDVLTNPYYADIHNNPPPTPTVNGTTSGDNYVTIAFTANGGNTHRIVVDLKHYTTSGYVYETQHSIDVGTTGNWNTEFFNLIKGVTYTYEVRAFNGYLYSSTVSGSVSTTKLLNFSEFTSVANNNNPTTKINETTYYSAQVSSASWVRFTNYINQINVQRGSATHTFISPVTNNPSSYTACLNEVISYFHNTLGIGGSISNVVAGDASTNSILKQLQDAINLLNT